MSAASPELEQLPQELEHAPAEVEAAVAPGRRSQLMRVASIGVSVVFLGAAAWWASKQKMPTLPSGTHAYTSLAGALLLYALATLCRGERWHRLLRHTSIHPKRIDSYAITTVGYAGNNVLPARAGEALRTFLIAGTVYGSKREIIGTIIAERVLDAAVLAVAFAFGAYGTLVSGSPFALLGIIVVGIAAVALFPSRLHPSPTHPRLKWIVDTAARLIRPTRSLISREGLLLLCLTFLIWSIEASVYFLIAHAVGLGISVDGAVFIMVVANFVSLIPAGPGYVGTFDAAVLFAARSLGRSRSVAVSYLLLLRFVLFIPITITGLLILVGRYGGLAGYRAAKLQAAEA
jgi:glycosyltransferase 2 family protein